MLRSVAFIVTDQAGNKSFHSIPQLRVDFTTSTSLNAPTRDVLDFEAPPSSSTAPSTLAPGVVVTAITPSGHLSPNAAAALRTSFSIRFQECGFLAFSDGPTTGSITFDPPVSRVDVYAGGRLDETVTLVAFDISGGIVGTAINTSGCPSLDAGDFMSVEHAQNAIAKIEIRADAFFAIDDLAYYRLGTSE